MTKQRRLLGAKFTVRPIPIAFTVGSAFTLLDTSRYLLHGDSFAMILAYLIFIPGLIIGSAYVAVRGPVMPHFIPAKRSGVDIWFVLSLLLVAFIDSAAVLVAAMWASVYDLSVFEFISSGWGSIGYTICVVFLNLMAGLAIVLRLPSARAKYV